jgi:hypothetical protein
MLQQYDTTKKIKIKGKSRYSNHTICNYYALLSTNNSRPRFSIV